MTALAIIGMRQIIQFSPFFHRILDNAMLQYDDDAEGGPAAARLELDASQTSRPKGDGFTARLLMERGRRSVAVIGGLAVSPGNRQPTAVVRIFSQGSEPTVPP